VVRKPMDLTLCRRQSSGLDINGPPQCHSQSGRNGQGLIEKNIDQAEVLPEGNAIELWQRI
jgi:hypothetical protein